MAGAGIAVCSIGNPEPIASFKADVPAAFDAARMWTFETCKDNVGCWSTQADSKSKVESISNTSYVELSILPKGPSLISVIMKLYEVDEQSTYIEVVWRNLRDAADGDHYTIKAFDPDEAPHALLDEHVTYRHQSHTIGPSCGTSWLQADVDRRTKFDGDAGE